MQTTTISTDNLDTPLLPAPRETPRQDGGTTDLFKAQYGMWIRAMKNHAVGPQHSVYLSTFQEGRGQHITALDPHLARTIGERLIALADEIDSESEAQRLRNGS